MEGITVGLRAPYDAPGGAAAVRAALRGPVPAAAGAGRPEREMVSVQEGKGNG